MDLFKPGLPKLVLHQIRSTNTISTKLLAQLKTLNDHTNFFLQTTNFTSGEVTPGSVEDIFRDFYYEFKIDANKLTLVPEVSMAKLKKYQAQLAEADLSADSNKALADIIAQYTVLIAIHHLANSVIYKTVVAKSQVSYWSDLNLSVYSKVVYGVQTMPVRAYSLVCAGFNNAVVTTQESSRVKLVYSALVVSFSEIWSSISKRFNANYVLNSSRLRFLKVPLNYLDAEVKTKLDALSASLDTCYGMLGLILNNLPVHQELLSKLFPDCEPELVAQLNRVEDYIKDTSESKKTAPPGFVTRYWPLLLVLLNYGPSTTSNVWTNREYILDWIKHNLVDTVVGFWKNWIVKPIGDMLGILRNDDTLTITSKESLKSDLDSLERMVIDFMKDNHVNVNPDAVRAAVAQGDLTMMMSQYENEIRTPYKLIMRGLLIRSMLIQVQKTKVDGALAINGIDKLLKLQQLLFGILSILPSLFILYQANKALHRDSLLSRDVVARRISCLKSMNQIEKLVSQEEAQDKLVQDGRLFVEIVNLTLLSRNIVPGKLRADFLHDLNELMLASLGQSERAKSAVNRIWNMYSPFFRRSVT